MVVLASGRNRACQEQTVWASGQRRGTAHRIVWQANGVEWHPGCTIPRGPEAACPADRVQADAHEPVGGGGHALELQLGGRELALLPGHTPVLRQRGRNGHSPTRWLDRSTRRRRGPDRPIRQPARPRPRHHRLVAYRSGAPPSASSHRHRRRTRRSAPAPPTRPRRRRVFPRRMRHGCRRRHRQRV